jgi:hypothetical protein
MPFPVLWNNHSRGPVTNRERLMLSDTGKRVERRGRKAMGLRSAGTRIARLPKEARADRSTTES